MEKKILIRRGKETLGEFDRFELRQAIDKGTLELSDEFLDAEANEWSPLLPPFRRKWNRFDWADDDEFLCFYLKDGMIRGPRTPNEIDALVISGLLDGSTLITTLGWDDWVPYGSLEEPLEDIGEDLKFEAKNAVGAFLEGDLITAGISGAKAAGKLWNWFTKPEDITSEWLSVEFEKKEFSSLEELIGLFEVAGFVPQASDVQEDKDYVTVYLQFSDIEEATRVRDECDFKLEFNGSIFPILPASTPQKNGDRTSR